MFEVYDALPQLWYTYDPNRPSVEQGPRFLQFFALLAFHVFIKERVDVAIVETHCGGEFDATNFIRSPVVTAVTTLGMDHVDLLGPRIEDIAWHKAGIFKTGAQALSTEQDAGQGVESTLRERAREKNARLSFVGQSRMLPKGTMQLKPAVQRVNASLAIAAADAWLKQMSSSSELTEEDINCGISQWSWPGRFQRIEEDNRMWFLDAAHNEMSLAVAAEWFTEESIALSRTGLKIVIFANNSEARNTTSLLHALASTLQNHAFPVQHAIFTTYQTSRQSLNEVEARIPPSFVSRWAESMPDTVVHEKLLISDAIGHAKLIAKDQPAHILITGSQYLVGASLRILDGLCGQVSDTSA